ncbi:hypothetical protein M501DRAFT_1034545 [Patellaria atrata CBS 101060]|uniref:Uncharacterized protein n=1 Tax=Patellaria atrata CBS 101060 TaxID=1346257 RepID=A0A9P4S358_9PEZI|nr:hypothetical protein M501DRAFT_1034545 [Patellaria atrata CBS 101060]
MAELAELQEKIRRLEARLQRKREKTRKTTLYQFVDICHTFLHLGLRVLEIGNSIPGMPSNVKGIPSHDKQKVVWNAALESDSVQKRRFTDRHIIEETGRRISELTMSSGLDLHNFLQNAVMYNVQQIIEEFHSEDDLRNKLLP